MTNIDIPHHKALEQRIAELEAEVGSLKELVLISCDELEECVNAEYPQFKLDYPHNKIKYDAEIKEINDRRSAMSALNNNKGADNGNG